MSDDAKEVTSEPMTVIFGQGKVGIARSVFPDEPIARELVFWYADKAMPVGTPVDCVGKTAEEMGTFLHFQFLSRESAEILHKELGRLVEDWWKWETQSNQQEHA